MTDLLAVADVLGLKVPPGHFSAMDMVKALHAGLPPHALDTVLDHLSDDEGLKHRIVPRASLARRQRAQRLSAPESERLARIARIWVMARGVWGSDEEARAFLFRPHPLIDDARPIDVVIDSEIGAQVVEDVLGRLQFGSAA